MRPVPDDEITLEWQPEAPADAFAGHFPGHVVLPGAYLLDGIVERAEAALGRPVRGVQSARFHSTLGPGAALEIRFVPGAGGRIRFSASSAGIPACTGTLLLAAP